MLPLAFSARVERATLPGDRAIYLCHAPRAHAVIKRPGIIITVTSVFSFKGEVSVRGRIDACVDFKAPPSWFAPAELAAIASAAKI